MLSVSMLVRIAQFKIIAHMTTTPSIVAKRLARHFALGRSRVLIPGSSVLVWVFSGVFLHHHFVIIDKATAGSVFTPQNTTTFLPHPSSPYPLRIFPSMWLPSFGRNEKLFLSLTPLLITLKLDENSRIIF
jgi:hypothetical protein